MPWVCTSTFLLKHRASIVAAAPVQQAHHGIGHHVRRFARHALGMSAPEAALAWTTCKWVAPPAIAGALAGGVAWVAWPSSWWSWSGAATGFYGSAPGAAGEAHQAAVCCAEPASIAVLAVAVGFLLAINEGRRQAMRKRARVYQFTPQDLADWPRCPRRIEPMRQAAPSFRGIAAGVAIGCALWAMLAALLFIPARMWGLL